MSVTSAVAFWLAAVAVVLGAHWLAARIRVPFTVLLTVIGGIYALLPGPNVVLRPDVVLALIIPPLLYNAALQASLLDFRRYLRPILSLSVGLVIATAVLTGAALSLAVGGLGFAAAVALGAAVAPPDPVAALSIGGRIGLPGKVTTVIEGEGLLNDATALTLLQVAVAAATGAGFSLVFAVGDFLLSAVGGAAVGIAVAAILGRIRPLREDALLANAVSLATPFACYLIGEELHVSGVLAVVVAGLIAGHQSPRAATSSGRLQVGAVWRLVNFLLEGLVFLLIGQQVPEVLATLQQYSVSTLLAATGATLGVVLLLRPLWLFASGLLPRRLSFGPRDGDERPFTAAELTVLTWAGTRGVITLAAAYTLPLDLPQRDLLLYCAFLVVAVTLLGQGLTFAPLVRRLGVRASLSDGIRQRNEARLAAVDAALTQLDSLEDVAPAVRDGLRGSLQERRRRYQHRLDALEADDDGQVGFSEEYLSAVDARRLILEAQRQELLRQRDSGHLTEADLRLLQRELDLQESQLPRVP
ncbi:MAG: Na+/H+ antiporter [Actinomycetales bacterium]